jgi:hypothetical membrane protein
MFNRIQTFRNRYPLIGPTFWVISIQYFITQLLVTATWPRQYSWANNAISDLGNTVCGFYSERYVCSPYHTWMNSSFIVLGATMVAGSLLIDDGFRKSVASRIGFAFMTLAGLGTILVGVFPENLPGGFHTLGAALPFAIGNVGLIILGLSLDLGPKLKAYTLLSGMIALAALPLFYTGHYLGLGLGGMERVVAYPQTIWLIVFGVYISRDRFRRIMLKNKYY